MQKFKLVGALGLGLVLGIFGCLYFTNNKSNETYEDIRVKENKELLSMMLETEAGSGKYQETTASEWPTDGYVFNETLSKCENGGTLSWDNTSKKVIMEGNSSDKCYVYFDAVVPVTYLADYIKSLYTTQGANNLYLHDSTLENGANDGSYRYAGSSDTTNNFVCFGYDSQDGSCPSDNLYRIIGVFDGEVKLIKYDYAKSTLLGTDGDYYNTYSGAGWSSSSYGTNKGQNSKSEIGVYYWNNNTQNNTWSESRLNTINLNTNYLNNIGSKWNEKIETHTWKVGGNTTAKIRDAVPSVAYTNEITSPATNTTYDAKIGLMYASDYGYAAAPSAWTTTLYNYNNSSITSVNWMYMGLYEWTMAPRTGNSNYAIAVNDDGYVDSNRVSNSNAARPVLYLKSTIGYGGGSGTAAKPILVK